VKKKFIIQITSHLDSERKNEEEKKKKQYSNYKQAMRIESVYVNFEERKDKIKSSKGLFAVCQCRHI
jgi:hypothetical protein